MSEKTTRSVELRVLVSPKVHELLKERSELEGLSMSAIVASIVGEKLREERMMKEARREAMAVMAEKVLEREGDRMDERAEAMFSEFSEQLAESVGGYEVKEDEQEE